MRVNKHTVTVAWTDKMGRLPCSRVTVVGSGQKGLTIFKSNYERIYLAISIWCTYFKTSIAYEKHILLRGSTKNHFGGKYLENKREKKHLENNSVVIQI